MHRISLLISITVYQIWCKNVDRRRNYGRKSKSKMAAVRHLEIDASSYRTTHEVFSLGHISPWNFMQIRCIFEDIAIKFFLQIWLEMPTYAQKISGFGGLNPETWLVIIDRPPKGTFLAGTALTCQFWYRSVHRCYLCARRRNQKKRKIEKRQGKKLTVANWVFVQTTHVDAAICGLACRMVFGR